MNLKHGDHIKWSGGEILRITGLGSEGQYTAVLLHDPNVAWKNLVGSELSTNICIVPPEILKPHEMVAIKLAGIL